MSDHPPGPPSLPVCKHGRTVSVMRQMVCPECEIERRERSKHDIKVVIECRLGSWRIRIGEGAVPILFDTFEAAAEHAAELLAEREAKEES